MATPGPQSDAEAVKKVPVERLYNASNVVASAKTLTLSEVPGIYRSIVSGTCFKTAFLWAGCIGGLFAAHRFKQGVQNGATSRVIAFLVFRDVSMAFSGTFGIQWYLCRLDEADKRLAVREFYASRERAMPAFSQPPSQDEVNSAPMGDDDEGWKHELQRLTQYDLPVVEEGPVKSVQLR